MNTIRAHGLTKTYRREADVVTALSDVSFSVDPGEVVALVGASGSGKSTLLNLVAGFDQADAGQVRIGDFEVTAASPAALDAVRTRTIGFVFQQFHLVAGLTASENVELALLPAGVPADERRQRARAALARLGLQGLEHRRPAQLSGGQQQRVAIARAFVGEPKLILADEPTAALDGPTATALLDQLVGMAKADGAAVLLSTHDARCIARCDRSITLENGKVQA